MVGYYENCRLFARRRQLAQPVLVVAGTADELLDSEREAVHLVQVIPMCDAYLVAGAGHAGTLDQRINLVGVIDAWMSERGIALAATAPPTASRGPPRRSPEPRACATQPDVPQKVEISQAELGDLDALVALTVRVFFGELGSDFGFNNNRATAFFQLQGEQAASLREKLQAGAFKAVDGGHIVGFVACGRDGVLTNLAVDPSHRRGGIGRRLIEHVLLAAKGPHVTLEVDEDNEAAIALYRACGFVVVEQREGTRYKVDWWRGRVVETGLPKVLMKAPARSQGV